MNDTERRYKALVDITVGGRLWCEKDKEFTIGEQFGAVLVKAGKAVEIGRYKRRDMRAEDG